MFRARHVPASHRRDRRNCIWRSARSVYLRGISLAYNGMTLGQTFEPQRGRQLWRHGALVRREPNAAGYEYGQ